MKPTCCIFNFPTYHHPPDEPPPPEDPPPPEKLELLELPELHELPELLDDSLKPPILALPFVLKSLLALVYQSLLPTNILAMGKATIYVPNK
jgi:hypothetical protein